MSNELTDVRCPCGAEFQADSYDAGFIAGSGMCQNCDAALPPKDICTCPSGDGSLRHPCQAHPAPVEQAGGDERDFQAKGAQEVPSPVSKEYDRHLISLLRKGEALPGHQEEAADEIERLRDWNDHLNNTVLPNILNPNFLMLMKGGERLLDLCTKDGEFIGVSLNDMKDVFDWMVTHARIAPDQAALAQPSPAQAEQAEAERPEVVAWSAERYVAGDHYSKPRLSFEQPYSTDRNVEALMTVAQHDRIVGELRADRDSWAEQAEQRLADWDEMRKERDAALAEVAGLRSLLNSLLCYVERDINRMRSDRDKSDNKEIYDRSISLAMERLKAAQNAVFTTEPGCDTAVELAAQTTQAQHSVPEEFSFEYRHPNGESHTVTVSRDQVINEMPDFLFEALCSKLCNCEPAGETNVVECCCDEYAEEFKLLAAAPGKEGV
ncbi:TPA: hypothetical protein RY210_002571 [Pseudomonas aeruginosa]|nr:hypothetical protein [Pseudomonas aeruginosa]